MTPEAASQKSWIQAKTCLCAVSNATVVLLVIHADRCIQLNNVEDEHDIIFW